MSKRLFILLVATAAALVLVPVSLAAVRVHVRVEGKTQTIFGAAEPALSVKANALDALESASLAGEFYYHVTVGGFGPYVDQIGRYPAGGSSGWVFKVNGLSPPVGADAVPAPGENRAPPSGFASESTTDQIKSKLLQRTFNRNTPQEPVNTEADRR